MRNRQFASLSSLFLATLLIGCGATNTGETGSTEPPAQSPTAPPATHITLFLDLESDLSGETISELAHGHQPELAQVEGLVQKYDFSDPAANRMGAAMLWRTPADASAYLASAGHNKRFSELQFRESYRLVHFTIFDTLRENGLPPAGEGQIMVLVSGLFSEYNDDLLKEKALERKPAFLAVDGLLQKYYIQNKEDGGYGGLYIFASREAAAAYKASPLKDTIATAYKLTGAPDVKVLPIERTVFTD